MAHDEYDHLRESADQAAPVEVWCSRCELASTVVREGEPFCDAHDPLPGHDVLLAMSALEAAALIDDIGNLQNASPALVELRSALLERATHEPQEVAS